MRLEMIRARLAQIASDNYVDEWGYPEGGTFEDIADAILDEFTVTWKASG